MTELIDYELFCGAISTEAADAARDSTISVVQLDQWLTERERGERDFVLIDVREPNEWDIVHIEGAELIPKGEFLSGRALEKLPNVDPKRVAAVGYGIGGTAVLELARSKAELEGVVCVHGDPTPAGNDGKSVGASVMVIVGADDPAVSAAQLAAFEAEMRSGGCDWQLLRLGGVAGDFTLGNKGSGDVNMHGVRGRASIPDYKKDE